MLNMSNVGDFSWSWILKDFISRCKKRKENWSSYVDVLQMTSHEKVSRPSRAVIVKEMYKKDWCTCRAVVLLKITIFLTLSLSCRGDGCFNSLVLGADPGGLPPPPPAIWRSGSTTHYCIQSSRSRPKLEKFCPPTIDHFWETIIYKTNVNV